MQLALYQPDIPQNLGSILRLCACMAVSCHVIEPCGFILDDRRMQRVGMDYIAQAELVRHVSWKRFTQAAEAQQSRILLLTTKASAHYCDFTYRANDILLLGRESAGVPAEVAARADARLTIPMAEGVRSLNIAQAASIALGEGLRQVRWGKAMIG